MIAYITGSGFYDMPGFDEGKADTKFGQAHFFTGKNNSGQEVVVLPRHGKAHHYLPHQINHRANLTALAEMGVGGIVSLSVCGVLREECDLAGTFLVDDLFFPENRMGDGSPCTLFMEPGEPRQGHLLAGSLFHQGLSESLEETLRRLGQNPGKAQYAHVPGPRFNTRCEIRSLQATGSTILSQTCGPEAVLANELEIPYAMVGFGVDYANGVAREPTPVEVLQTNLSRATDLFTRLVQSHDVPNRPWTFENFVYRFD